MPHRAASHEGRVWGLAVHTVISPGMPFNVTDRGAENSVHAGGAEVADHGRDEYLVRFSKCVDARGDVHLQPKEIVVICDRFSGMHAGADRKWRSEAAFRELATKLVERIECSARAGECEKKAVAEMFDDLPAGDFDAGVCDGVVFPQNLVPPFVAELSRECG